MSTDTTDRSHLDGFRQVEAPGIDLRQAFAAAVAETPFEQADEGALLRMTEEQIRELIRQSHIPTVVPCPTWCGLPTGHGYDSMATAQGEPCRTHIIDFTPPNKGRFGVDLNCCEVLLDGQLLLGDITIDVYEPGRNVTPDEARAMAAALTAAATRLEEMRSQGLAA